MEIKIGTWVNCEYGLGQVKDLDGSKAKIYIQSFGCRWIDVSKLRISRGQ